MRVEGALGQSVHEVFEEAAADAALAASIFHDGHYTVEALKRAINEESPVALRYERNEK